MAEKRVDQLDPFVGELTNDLLLVICVPVTGKSYKLTLAQIKELYRKKIIFNADGFYTVPAGTLIDAIIVIPTVPINLKIGDSAGSDEILQALPINDREIITPIIETAVQRNIYFSGITGNGPVSIIFIKNSE